jgi:hypothetical protein
VGGREARHLDGGRLGRVAVVVVVVADVHVVVGLARESPAVVVARRRAVVVVVREAAAAPRLAPLVVHGRVGELGQEGPLPDGDAAPQVVVEVAAARAARLDPACVELKSSTRLQCARN